MAQKGIQIPDEITDSDINKISQGWKYDVKKVVDNLQKHIEWQ